MCEWGRDSVESWGRKRRSIENGTQESEEEMNISQEILVLDFGDEHNRDFLRSDPSTDFGKGNIFIAMLMITLVLIIFFICRQNSHHH